MYRRLQPARRAIRSAILADQLRILCAECARQEAALRRPGAPPNREYQLGFMAGGITAIIHALEAK